MSSYAASGVHRDLGDEASRIFYEAAQATWQNRVGRLGEVIVPVDDYSGVRAVDVSGLPPGTLMNLGFDGIGTKIELAERAGNFRTVAHDLFAMVCDDAVVRGAEPVLVGSILDVRALGSQEEHYLDQVRQLACGYVEAAAAAGVAVVNGEVAELGDRVGGYGPFNATWGAAVAWFARRDRLLTGYSVRAGDAVVALRERGFRSNGLSLARKIFGEAYGEEWHVLPWGPHTLGAEALAPSTIYAKAVCGMFGGVHREPLLNLHAVAHITGGGIPEKLGRALRPSGLGATLETLFEPPIVMSACQEEGGVPDEEAYRTWNMGQGMLVVTPDPDGAVRLAAACSIEARIAGEIDARPGIRLRSLGANSPGKMLEFK